MGLDGRTLGMQTQFGIDGDGPSRVLHQTVLFVGDRNFNYNAEYLSYILSLLTQLQDEPKFTYLPILTIFIYSFEDSD